MSIILKDFLKKFKKVVDISNRLCYTIKTVYEIQKF